MDRYKFEFEEFLLIAMSKFMILKLEDGEDPNKLFFTANSLREMIKRHVETISDHA